RRGFRLGIFVAVLAVSLFRAVVLFLGMAGLGGLLVENGGGQSALEIVALFVRLARDRLLRGRDCGFRLVENEIGIVERRKLFRGGGLPGCILLKFGGERSFDLAEFLLVGLRGIRQVRCQHLLEISKVGMLFGSGPGRRRRRGIGGLV